MNAQNAENSKGANNINEAAPIQRDIQHVTGVTYRQTSKTHKMGFILEPGRWEEHDPFLLMAEDWFQKGDFALHPHRGMETVTYVLEGKLEHYDNKAGSGELGPGDVQWMTAGSGVIHLEDPAEGETVHSLQLWVNLPSTLKMTDPRYQNLRRNQMKIRHQAKAKVVVFSGASGEIKADTRNHTPVTMVEINMEPGGCLEQDLPGDYNGFIYILEGSGIFGTNEIKGTKGQVLWLGSAKAGSDSVITLNAEDNLRALLYAGQPIREPVVARGPFVMNSDDEIKQAYKDYNNGQFGK